MITSGMRVCLHVGVLFFFLAATLCAWPAPAHSFDETAAIGPALGEAGQDEDLPVHNEHSSGESDEFDDEVAYDLGPTGDSSCPLSTDVLWWASRLPRSVGLTLLYRPPIV